MSELDRDLEAAYQAQQNRQKSLEQSKLELEAVSKQGAQLASRSRVLILSLVALSATIGSGVLMIDPESRPWGFLLFFVVVLGGLWSYYKNWKS